MLRSRFVLAAAGLALVAGGLSACSSHTTVDQVDPTGIDSSGLITDDRVADDSLAILGVYEVQGSEIVDDVNPSYAKVWERFTQLVDVTAWPQITLFVALDRDASPGGTDGALDHRADAPDEYYMALDVTDSEPAAELDATMIHEFGHLVTLNADQIPADTSQADTCPVFTVNDDCAREGSYFRTWSEAFWPGYLHADAEAEPDTAAADRFATGEFVTEYAASAPYEDIAESFSAWVREDSEPSGDTVVDQKLRFFDDYPELVELKEHARESL